VADQHIAGEAKPASDGLDIISHRGKIVSFIGRNRRAPAALIESDTARLAAKLLNHAAPGARRAAPVMQ
jgi:hypothetical protein